MYLSIRLYSMHNLLTWQEIHHAFLPLNFSHRLWQPDDSINQCALVGVGRSHMEDVKVGIENDSGLSLYL